MATITTDTHFVCVRHGDTPRTEVGATIQGGSLNDDLAKLSEKGIKAAELLGNELANRYVDQIMASEVVIVSSPLDRCTQTAQKISEAFKKKLYELVGGSNATYPIEQFSDLREIDHGKFEGMNGKLRNEKCLKWYQENEMGQQSGAEGMRAQDWRWQVNPLSKGIISQEDTPNPLGEEPETIAQVYERGVKVLHEIGERFEGKTVIAVTSGAILWTLATKLNALENNSTEEFRVYYEPPKDFYPDPCSIIHFKRANGTLYFKGKEDLLDSSKKI